MNSFGEFLTGTAVGGSIGKGLSSLVGDIGKVSNKVITSISNFIGSLYKDTTETVSKTYADENK